MRLDDELDVAKCRLDAEGFKQLVRETYLELHGGMPDEQLSQNPDEAKHFCKVIRDRSRTQRLSDATILRTLSNLRKRMQLEEA